MHGATVLDMNLIVGSGTDLLSSVCNIAILTIQVISRLSKHSKAMKYRD